MRVLAVIDHPWDQSFNHALLAAARRGLQAAGHEVDVVDLHRDQFDPVMRREELAIYSQGKFLDPRIGAYQVRIMQAQHLLFVFPVWWEVMPAMLKGWLDKVLLPGWAFNEADVTPLLTHITGATVITTMGAPEVKFTSVEAALCKGTLGFCGVQKTHWINFLAVSDVSQEKRVAWLAEVETYARSL